MVDENDMDEKDDARSKSRNLSEKKRRDQFNLLIHELCSMVTSSSRKMDKSSVLRSAISFLRSHSELSVQSHNIDVQENWKPSFLSNEEFTHLMLEALHGFIIVFSCTGRILYTSESIAPLLGYPPNDICSSVFDIVHESDRSSLYKLINNAPPSANNSSKETCSSLLVHMKRGPIHSNGTTMYELVRLLGTFHHWPSSFEGPTMYNMECDSNSCSSVCSPLSSAAIEWRLCFVAIARLQSPHLLRVVTLPDENKNEFISRHSLEWTVLFLDHRAPPIIGYLPFEVLGTSGYDYYHVDDLENVAAGHEQLMQTGEGTSCFYRFLTKGQQWIWLQTHYYISYHQWNSKPEFVVCTHAVVSYEHVQTSIHEAPKKSDPVSKKQMFSDLPRTSSSPNQSTCISPAPSASSMRSLSSDHSERCSGEENHNPFLSEKQMGQDVSAEELNHLPTVQSTSSSVLVPPLSCSFVPNQGNGSAQDTVPVVSVSAIQPFLGIPASLQITSMDNPETQGQTSQSERLQPTFIMTSSQGQLQDYLRKRHQMLQQQIMAQQEELRRVSEQLMLVQFIGPNVSTPNTPYHIPVSVSPIISESNTPIRNLPQAVTHSAEKNTSIEILGSTHHSAVSSNSFINSQGSIHMVCTSGGMSLPREQSQGLSLEGFSSSHSLQHD